MGTKFSIKIPLSLFLWMFICFSCHSPNSRTEFDSVLKYENGVVYSTGKYLCIIKKEDTLYRKIKDWSYNYPNGTIWKREIYNDEGTQILEYNSYYQNGSLNRQYKAVDDIEEDKLFDKNGVLKYWSKVKGATTSSTYSEEKQFYSNGMVFNELISIDDEEKGSIIYDSLGVPVLRLINKRGLWVKSKEQIHLPKSNSDD